MAPSSTYHLARPINLIKSPAISVPPPITFPNELHPLPPDLHAYFVYPFSLETYVLDPRNPNSKTIEELHARHTQYIESRREDKLRRERDRIRRVAPGWDAGASGPLQPTKRSSTIASSGDAVAASLGQTTSTVSASSPPSHHMDAMQELVDHLTKLDAAAEERDRQQQQQQR